MDIKVNKYFITGCKWMWLPIIASVALLCEYSWEGIHKPITLIFCGIIATLVIASIGLIGGYIVEYWVKISKEKTSC